MVLPKSFLKVVDNSGAKYARCIKVLKTASCYGKKRYAQVGDLILVSVRFCIPHKSVKKGEIYTAVVVRSRAFVKRSMTNVYFWENGVILLDKKFQPVGTRVFGPIAREVRVKKYTKLVTMAKFVI